MVPVQELLGLGVNVTTDVRSAFASERAMAHWGLLPRDSLMETKCFNCGGILQAIQPGAHPGVCRFCGAPRVVAPFAPRTSPATPTGRGAAYPPRPPTGPALGRTSNVVGVIFAGSFILLGAASAGFHVMRKDAAPGSTAADTPSVAIDYDQRMPVSHPVSAADVGQRDWLGRGYTLQAIEAVDPSIDVDHAKAAIARQFPAASSEVRIGLTFTMVIDHPWYGDANLTWGNAKGGTLQEMRLGLSRPDGGTSQAEVEACVRAALGKPGRVGWTHVVRALNACGRTM